jgi:hypothetical protein
MLTSIRNRLTFANVVSVIALFVALGGTSVAASIVANSVGTNQLKNQAVTTSKIKDGAVTGTKLAPITPVSKTSDAFATSTAGGAFIQCPAGTTLVGGGGAGSEQHVWTTLSRKSGSNGWRYDAFNFGGGPATVTVFAYCLK